MTEITIKSVQFQKEREDSWLELEEIITKVEKKGIGSLSSNEITRLPILNRYALSSLSVARSILLDQKLLQYLESLTRRSYLVVYGMQKRSISTLFSQFFLEFPRIVRRFKWAFLLSTFVFLAGAIVGYVSTMHEPDTYYSIVPPSLQGDRGPMASTETMRASLYNAGDNTMSDELIAFAASLFSHNAQIGLIAVALGILLGLPVFYLLFVNGEILGTFAAAFEMHNLSFEMWGWILPHGIPEIGAILLCGGAGLMLAQAILFPGTRTRAENLAMSGRKVGVIVVGCIILFYFAGIIEGILRQVIHNNAIRYTMALTLFSLSTYYLLFVGRKPKKGVANEYE